MKASHFAVTLLVALAAGAAGGSVPSSSLVIDRWLISDPFPRDSSVPENRLDERLLNPPGEQGVLPDRGMSAAGTVWHLYREDGAERIEPQTLLPSVENESVVFAHSYVRFPEDRTLRFVWAPEDCAAGRAWLNGRRLIAADGQVRFGAGWNTILLKLQSGDCPLRFQAAIESDSVGGLAGIRVQASRPPGEVRTGPEPWVTLGPEATISSRRSWRGDRLFADVEVPLTGWGRSPVPGVELKLKGAVEGRREAQWLTPGERMVVPVPVRLDRLDRLADGSQLTAEVLWEGGSLERSLALSGLPASQGDTLRLDGWLVDGRAAGQIPTAAGSALAGEWKVPAALAGRTLLLLAGRSPGVYRVGDTTETDGERVTLCGPCTPGTRLRISVRTTGPWQAMPPVVAE